MKDESAELIEVIGKEATLALAEEFAGTRLYVPISVKDAHRISRVIGTEAAKALVGRFGPDTIRVPLMRELRARHYRDNLGLSHARIAVRLGLTENGVGRIFQRLKRRD